MGPGPGADLSAIFLGTAEVMGMRKSRIAKNVGAASKAHSLGILFIR